MEPIIDQLTSWFDPNEKFLSGKGVVTRRQWCYDEAARFQKIGRIAEVRYDILGRCAVFIEIKRK